MTGLISPLGNAASDQASAPPDVGDDAHQPDDLSLVRDLVLKAHPDVVPELISGDSVTSMMASIGPARDAYAQLAAKIQASTASAPRVPAGSTVAAPIDLDRLPASEKLRRGVQDRANRAGQ